MAETMLSDADLGRIDHGLDELILPSPEESRAMVAEIRLLRRENARYGFVLSRIGQLVDHAARGVGR